VSAKKEIPKIRVLVLDVLKPHHPDIAELGQFLGALKGVHTVNITVYANDEKTESVKVVLEGPSVDFSLIRQKIDIFGAVVHSVDKVVVGGKKIIQAPQVPEFETRK
jgi:uncharacterized protein